VLTYSWQSSTTSSTTGYTSIPSAFSATYDPPTGLTTTTYYQVVTTSTLNGIACSATSNPLLVTVVSNPTANAGPDANVSCLNNSPGVTIGMGSIGGVNYSWSPSNGLSSSTLSNPTASPLTTTTYTLTATDISFGCVSTDQVTVNVNLTVPNVEAGNNFNITCTTNPSGAGIGMTASTGVTYSWSPSTGLSSSSLSNPNANPSSTTTYTLTATNTASGCTANDQVTVTVNTTPPLANAGTDFIKTCVLNPNGATVGDVAVSGVTYSWTPATGLSSSTVSNPTANPTQTTTYIVTATNTANGCTATDDVTVTVDNSFPTVNAGIDQVICQGSSVTLTATGTDQYSWSNGVVNGVSFVPTSPTNYTVTGTDLTTGCVSTDVVTVTVNPIPTANPLTNQVVCNSGSTNAIVFTGNVTNTVFNWTNSTTSIGLAASGQGSIASFIATNATNVPIVSTLTVQPTYTNLGVTCTGTSQNMTITVNPTPQVDPINNQGICVGSSSTEVVFSSAFGVSGTAFNWTNTNSTIGIGSAGNGNIPSFTGTNNSNNPINGSFQVTPTFTNQNVTCNGAAQSFLITVNPTPTVVDPTDLVVCNNATVQLIVFSGSNANSLYTWTNNTTSINLPSTGTNAITSFPATNLSNAPVTATISVTPSLTNAGITCTGASELFNVTVNPTPTVDPLTSQAVCVGSPTSTVNFTSNLNVSGTVYSWTNTNASIGLISSGTGPVPSFTTTNTGNTPQTGTVTVTPSITLNSVTCTGSTQSMNIVVNPIPTVVDPLDQVVCNGGLTQIVNFNGTVNGTIYNWTNSNPAINLLANGTGSIPSFVATNTTNSPISSTITVTPSYTNAGTTCSGTPQSFTITVNPTPTVDPISNQALCVGSTTNAVNFTSGFGVNSTVFNWTNSNPSIGLIANGTGNIGSFTTLNTSNSPATGTVIVTPSYENQNVTCNGTTQSFSIVVNPIPTVVDPIDQILCNGAQSVAVNFSGAVSGTVYNWTNTNTSINLGSNGTGNIPGFNALNSSNAAVSGTITVTPVFTNAGTTCTGSPNEFTLTVLPTPTVDAISNQVECVGAATDAVLFTSGFGVTGTVFNWTNSNTAIGLGANGVGDIPSFTTTNTGNTMISGTIAVLPTVSLGGTTCQGTTQNFSISVNPIPTVNDPLDQVVCNGAQTAAVNFTGTVTGTVYTWTSSNTAIGIGSGATGNILSFTALNTTNAPIQSIITVTPSYQFGGTTCTGSSQSFTITVNPTPTVDAFVNQGLCVGETTNPISFTSSFGVNGTQFNWINSNSAIGLPSNGSGNIGSFTATNSSNNPITGTITVTPQIISGGVQCQGTSQTAVITVNPIPTVIDPLDQVICNGASTNAVTFNGAVNNTVFTWTNSITSIGLGAGANGNIPSFTAQNSGTTPVTSTVTVTPSYTNALATCIGTPQTMTITVNPTPTVADPADVISCNGGTVADIIFQGTGTQYTWTNTVSSIGLAANGSGNINSFTAVNTTSNPVTATVSVQPQYLNAGLNCSGTIQSFLITVNPSPVVNFSIPNQTICSQTLSSGVTITSPTANAGITWSIPNPPAGITGLTSTNGTTTIPSMTLENTTSSPIVIQLFASATTPGSLACPGAGSLYTITVNPIPQLLDPVDQVVCSGNSTAAVPFNGSGTSYSWSNSTTSIGLTSSGLGTVPSFVAQNGTQTVITSTVTVTPFFLTNSVNCPGPNQTFTFTVNPIPTVNAASDFTICNGELSNVVTFGGTGTSYEWTNNNPAIGLTANGTDIIPAFQGTNSSSNAITGTLTVTPIFENLNVSCQGPTNQLVITVNPSPLVDDPTDQVVCNATSTSAVNFTGTGTSYTWINSNTGIGLGGNGTGNIPSFNALNSSTSPVSTTITVTPQFTGTNLTCPGTPQTYTVTVNPTPSVNNPTDQVICNGQSTQLVSITGTGTSYSWVNNTPSIGLPATGSGNINSFVAINPNLTPLVATVTITPTFTGTLVSCDGQTQDVQFTINPTPSLVDPSDQVVCNGSVTTGVNFSGNGTSYTWINSNPSIGLAASGTGNIAPFTALNNSNSPITATITVIPNFTGGLASCNGANQSFTITINPSPTVADLPDQTICNGSSTSPLNFTGTGTSYAWINSNTTIGLSGSGSNNITSFTAVNNGSSPISGTVTVTAQYTNANLTCNGQQQAIVFTVNPTPTVITPANITICNGSSSPTVVIGGTATSYSWTNSNPSIGLSANGTGNIPSFSAVNASNGAITATITITPIFALNGETCYGNDQQFTLTVNPTPTVSDPLDQTICNGSLTTAVNFIGTGNNYSWTTTNTSIGLSSSGNGNIPIFTGINTGSTPLLALVQVTPEYTNSGIVCSGPPQIFQIEVSPTPVVNDPLDVAYCNNGAVAAVTFSGTATNYSWTNTVTTIGLAANGIGSISSFQGTNTTQQAITSTVTVTPFFTNPSLTCPGQPQNFTITINPTPTVVDPLDQVVCNQSQTNAISFSGSATTFNWTNSLSTIGLPVSGIGNIAPFVALNTTSIATQATLFVTPTFIGSGISCPGNPVTFTISVNPSPHVNTIAPITICNNETFNVSLSSDIPSVFSWNALSSIPVTGEVILPQTSSSISNTLTNTSSVLQNVIYTVTPVSAPAGCIGPDSSFLVTVVPDVLLSLPPSIEICSGASVNAVLSANIGANFSWFTTFDNPNVLGESITTSSGALINDVLINTTNTNQVVIYSVTPTSIIGNCTGAAQTIAVTVKPPLELLNEDSVTICSGSSVGLNLEANTTVTFNWYANPTISIGGESINVVSSSLISDVLTNTTSTYQEITYFVIGSSTVSGCSSPIIPIHVTVNPLPVLSNLPDITFCSGIVTPAITFGTTQNVTYEWDNANSSIGLPLSGNGPIQGFLTTGSNSIPTNAAISVTPTYTHNSISCIGTNDQFLITINPTPTINPIADLSLCEGGTTTAINFSSQTVNTIFSWVNTESTIGLGATGSGNIPSFVVSNSTNSPLIANVSVVPTFSNNGVSCSGNNEDFLITVHPLASLLSSGGTICSEQNVNLNLNTDIPSAISWQAVNNLNINGESLVPQLSSTLTDQLTNLTTTQQTVNYIVSLLTNGFGCTSGPFTVPVLIHPNPVAIFTTTTSPLCDLSPVQFQNLSTGATDYLWDFGNANISTATNPAFTFGSFGSFNVELIASNAATGCTDSLVLPIVLQASPPVNFTSSVNEGCATLEVIFTDLNNTPFTELLWDFGDGATSAQPGNIDHQYINEGCYDVTLTVTNAGGCSSTLTTTDMVCVYDLPIADFSFTPDSALVSDPIVEFTNLSTNSNTYLWEFGDGNTSNSTNPIHEYEQNTETYYITLFAYNEIGCVDTSVAEFIVYEDLIFYVPNSFTPNNDGTNDVFLPVITAGLDDQKYTLLIFNRWGEIVFESNDPSVGWDGSYLSINEMLTGNETNAQSGVYTWKILLNKNKNEGAVEKVGHVTLLR
jgi:gliding motility-associated-like protein